MAVLIVTNLNDSGDGSLRQAIQNANTDSDTGGGVIAAGSGADTIVFAPGLTGQITLTTGELVISSDVTIDGDVDGDDKADITISGNDASRIFNISGPGIDATLSSLMLRDGLSSGPGGAILVDNGVALTIEHSSLVNNSATGVGGAVSISYGGSLVLTNSLVSGNNAQNGGGVDVSALANATINNSTIVNNTATITGGGISAGGSPGGTYSSVVTVQNSTVTDNVAGSSGGGISLYNTIFNIANSAVAGNLASAAGSEVAERQPSKLNAGNSFFGVAVALDTDQGGNINGGGDPGLGALQDNGGTVHTRNILPDSELINAGGNTTLTTDANGNDRIVAGTVDIGATEFLLVVTTEADVVDANDGKLSLREAVTLANANSDPDMITFDAALAGQTITLSSAPGFRQLTLTQDVTINGDLNRDGRPTSRFQATMPSASSISQV